MQQGVSMDDEVRVKLTDGEILERAETMAEKLVHIGSLRFGDAVVPSAEQATAALAAVAQAAGEDAANLGQELAAPLPSEPHQFLAVAAEVDQCTTCGAGLADPVHVCDHGVPIGREWCNGCQTTEAATRQPHPYRIGDSDACMTCGSEHADARIHRSPVAVVTLPEDVACLSCKAGECKVHPHAFSPGEPENKCARCGKSAKARIHVEREALDDGIIEGVPGPEDHALMADTFAAVEAAVEPVV